MIGHAENARVPSAVARWFDDEVADWQIGRGLALLLLAGPVVFAGIVALTIPIRPLYAFFVEEDAIVEWLQVAVLIGIIGTGIAMARRLVAVRSPAAVVFVLGVVGTAFIVGEEISWGQRIFGWATPEQLEALNQQGETNIHNIGSVLRIFNFGMMTIALLAAVLPVAWRAAVGSRNRRGFEILFLPPLFLVPSFLIAFTYRAIRFTVVPEGRFVVTHYQEVTELIFYVALLAFLVLVLRRTRGSPAAS